MRDNCSNMTDLKKQTENIFKKGPKTHRSSDSRWQNRKERPNRCTNNKDMVHRPKGYVVGE